MTGFGHSTLFSAECLDRDLDFFSILETLIQLSLMLEKNQRENASIATSILVYSDSFWCVAICIVAVSSTIGSYKNLRDNRSLLSPRTRALYLTLTNALVIETLMGLILAMIPLFSLAWFYRVESKYCAIITLLTERTSSLYPLVSNVILLYVVKPYRKAVIHLFERVFKPRKLPLFVSANPESVVTS
ncbi:serpentine type 7TM GPCR chemoreceptor srh domain-containing protein [Ditylenchus destructor]|uniref:Serpentine type 7TM GPCR chemoreceptor srh domain-containing protein n=1 Tax=Ditylenchus destructor TaxID=166010 RepID=A0AAD4MI50_9BILA|nr:serpentine type 7TM GPCR chemoreceptor srh domain-containing protein [Ditylenchus destructor]